MVKIIHHFSTLEIETNIYVIYTFFYAYVFKKDIRIS